MFGWGKEKKKDDGLVILRSARAGECGGTDATQDTRAPKKILSDVMTFFCATSVLGHPSDEIKRKYEPLGYVSAFAAPCGEGTFLFLETSDGFRRGGERKRAWTLVKGDIFPTLADIVCKYDLAHDNGYHSHTHGLPENFGGSIDVKYESGERISVSDNQSPVLSFAAAVAIKSAFDKSMAGEKVALPSVDLIEKICFEEKRDVGFTRAALTIRPDGTAVNEKQANYGEKTYESVKEVGAETVCGIKDIIVRTGLLAWERLQYDESGFGGEKTLTFVFCGGETIVVRNNVVVPQEMRDGFFNVELELTTKN
ncbi:MAG: hypothetical protein IKP68_02450 [Clostridia bacterium]|nr:hypothetical protein [Clostridia bacterium]